MTQITLIPQHAFLRVPWKNGQGFTYEIFKSCSADTDRFEWRLSIAEVKEDGPFSNFEGYQRNITVLDGRGMTLHVDDHPSGVLGPFQSFTFKGDATTTCILAGGKIHDFNVIYDPKIVKADVLWLTPEQCQNINIQHDSHCFLISGAGESTVQVDGSDYHLNTWDVVHIETKDQAAQLSFPSQIGSTIGIVMISSL